VASYFLLAKLRPHWRSWLERLKQAGATVSLDPNWDPEDCWEGMRELLPLVDVLLPNENEALRISGASEVREAGPRLASGGAVVVIKRGGEGAIAFAGGESVEARPEPVVQIADSIGAGDNFDAGFVRGWLLGWPVEQCLRLGTRCAVASLAGPGGIEGQLRERIGESETR